MTSRSGPPDSSTGPRPGDLCPAGGTMAPHASIATMSLGSGPQQHPVSPRLALPAGGWVPHHDTGQAWQPRSPAARAASPGAGRLAGRYALALGQLGRDELDVRIDGIRALARVARDSPGHHPAVMGVLADFIRERSGPLRPPPGPGRRAPEPSP